MSEQPEARLTTTRLTPTPCPHCHASNDAATGEGVPTSGDAGFCFTCGQFAIYENGPFGLLLRLPTEKELADVRSQENTRRMEADWLRFRFEHPRRAHG